MMYAEDYEAAGGRECQDCGQWKPWSEYALDKRRVSKHVGNCKSCMVIRTQEWRKRYPDRYAANMAMDTAKRRERREAAKVAG